MNLNKLKATIEIDNSELDSTIEKAKELENILERVDILINKIKSNFTQEMDFDGVIETIKESIYDGITEGANEIHN